MWGPVTVCDLVNHVLEYIAWALDREKVEGSGVTIAFRGRRQRRSGSAGPRLPCLLPVVVGACGAKVVILWTEVSTLGPPKHGAERRS